jgi:hypothetical protein
MRNATTWSPAGVDISKLVMLVKTGQYLRPKQKEPRLIWDGRGSLRKGATLNLLRDQTVGALWLPNRKEAAN